MNAQELQASKILEEFLAKIEANPSLEILNAAENFNKAIIANH